MRVITGTARGRRLKEPVGLGDPSHRRPGEEGICRPRDGTPRAGGCWTSSAAQGRWGLRPCPGARPMPPLWTCGRRRWGSSGRTCPLTGFSDRATVVQGDYLAFLTRCRETFDVIFLDPPYGSGMLEKALETITTIDIVSENGIIVCENGSTVGWPAVTGTLSGSQKEYRYGKIRTALYRRQADLRIPAPRAEDGKGTTCL